MKRNSTLLLIALILLGCCRKTDEKKVEANTRNSEFVEVHEEPRHRLVFENENLKILDVQINPRDTTLFHRHRNPMYYISLGWEKYSVQLLNDDWGPPSSEELPIGEAILDTTYQSQPIVHRVTNSGTKTSRLIGVLNMGKGLTINDKSQGDEAPNSWFRSKRMNLNPGDTIDVQKTGFPKVIVLESGDEIRFVKNNESEIHSKKWLYLEDIDQLINSGNSKMELFKLKC